MQKSKIEWLDGGYSINPVKGLCPVDCKDNQGKSYCYARRLYKRFKWNPEIRFQSDAMDDCLDLPKGSKVFVGSTFELFGKWVKPEWLKSIFGVVELCPDITFIFLTKRPWDAKKYSFPENAWLGISVDTMSRFGDIQTLNEIKVKHRLVSFEPLLDFTPPDFRGIDWVIIGQQTPVKKATMPKLEWIAEIIEAASRMNIPVFLKNNLASLIPQGSIDAKLLRTPDGKLRQEFPSENI